MTGQKAGGKVYKFSPLIKEDKSVLFFGVEDQTFGLMDLAGEYWEFSTTEEVLSFAQKRKAVLLSFGGMRKDFHVFKEKHKVLVQGSWTAKIGNVFAFDLMGYASFTGHLSLKEWARDWGVEYSEDLRGRLNALRLLYLRLMVLGADYTPGRTARKVLMEWLRKPVVSFIPDRLELVGGRTQIFFHQAEDVYVYDFNSMYPSVMAYCKFPFLVDRGDLYVQTLREVKEEEVVSYVESLGALWEKITLREPPNLDGLRLLSRFLNQYYFLKVRISGFPKGLVPPAPFASTYEGRRVWLAIPDAEYHVVGYEVPLLQGMRYQVLSAQGTFADYLPFASKVVEFYEKRRACKQKKDKVCEGYYKAVLNAIFGVFGIKQKHVASKEKTYVVKKEELKKLLQGATFIEGDDYGNVEVYQYLKGSKKLLVFTSTGKDYLVVERLNEEDFIGNSIPALAVSVPASGRFLLLWLMRYLIHKGHKVFYCDTDSVHTSCPPEKLKDVIGDGLLELKFEGHFQKAYYFAPKTYYLVDDQGKGYLVAKGVKDFEDELIMYSFSRKEPMVVVRQAIDPESVPLTVPELNPKRPEDKFMAVLNVQKLKFKDTPLYEMYQKVKRQSQGMRLKT